MTALFFSMLFLPHLVYLYSFLLLFYFLKESNLLQVRDAQGVPLVIAGWQRLVFGLSNLSEDHKAPKVRTRTGTFLSKQDTIGHIFLVELPLLSDKQGLMVVLPEFHKDSNHCSLLM